MLAILLKHSSLFVNSSKGPTKHVRTLNCTETQEVAAHETKREALDIK